MKRSFLVFLVLISGFVFSQEVSHTSVRKDKVESLKKFLKGKNYNQELAFLIDFRIPSNKFRFFVYDLKNDSVISKAIVSHGYGSEVDNSKELVFSNVENSFQSSLGKYEIGHSYVGNFGKSYRLKGLDTTNSNAMKRAIVLHSYYNIPDTETQYPASLSLGCPMLSPNFFKIAEEYIDSAEKPIILYAFY